MCCSTSYNLRSFIITTANVGFDNWVPWFSNKVIFILHDSQMSWYMIIAYNSSEELIVPKQKNTDTSLFTKFVDSLIILVQVWIGVISK